MSAQVIDASARFACRRDGHVPSMDFQPSVFIEKWICQCQRCGEYVEIEMPKPKPLA